MPARVTIFDDPEILAEAIDLYVTKGASIKALAARYGCGYEKVTDVLRAANVAIRPRGGSNPHSHTPTLDLPPRYPATEKPKQKPVTRARCLVLTEMPWRLHALCRTEGDPEAFYPDGAGAGWRAAEAKAVCNRCEVREQCLAWAMENREEHGVWGGLTDRERRALRRKNKKTGRAAA